MTWQDSACLDWHFTLALLKSITNILEIGEAGASVKHLAKTIQGSTYVIDRRKHHEND